MLRAYCLEQLMTIVSLVFTGKLMSALLSGIHDRSTVVQKAFAFALGHLVRVSTTFHQWPYDNNNNIGCLQWLSNGLLYLVLPHQTAKDSSVEKLLLKLNTWYLEKEGEKTGHISSTETWTHMQLNDTLNQTVTFVCCHFSLVPQLSTTSRAGVQVIMCIDRACYQPLQSWCAEEPCRSGPPIGLPGNASGTRSWWGERRKPWCHSVGWGVAGKCPRWSEILL